MDASVSFSIAVVKYVYILLKAGGVFHLVKFGGLQFYLDCTDYLKELLYGETETKLDSSSSSFSKIFYTKDLLTRHESFLSTFPNSEFYY